MCGTTHSVVSDELDPRSSKIPTGSVVKALLLSLLMRASARGAADIFSAETDVCTLRRFERGVVYNFCSIELS